MLTGQLPKEVRIKAKAEIADKEPLTEIEAGEFIMKVKEFLSQNGLAIDIGLRSFIKVATLRDEPAEKQFNNLDDPNVSQENAGVNALRLKPRQTRNWRGIRRASSQLECYQCHERAMMEVLPKRVCGICGGKGHDPACRPLYENAVTLEVWANGVKLHAMLDTGAKPSVLEDAPFKKSVEAPPN
ncbi:hypothetical protein LOD99_2159 [Oopsacas minuta]|uniref:Peptidase A2 domain-containing protein n=1 Tax=Oopsacas minuta TaxID=111878 RepID=A0AAV7K3Y2_9METZ|nr:hypothetical protein LOD99_2159 [Oopsacas minuta]